MHERTDAMVNGALIILGAAGLIDNILIHWILEFHRAVPLADPYTFLVEAALVIISVVFLTVGFWRERRARRSQ